MEEFIEIPTPSYTATDSSIQLAGLTQPNPPIGQQRVTIAPGGRLLTAHPKSGILRMQISNVKVGVMHGEA